MKKGTPPQQDASNYNSNNQEKKKQYHSSMCNFLGFQKKFENAHVFFCKVGMVQIKIRRKV